MTLQLVIYKNSNVVKLERTDTTIMYLIVDKLLLPENTPTMFTIHDRNTIEHIMHDCYDNEIKPDITQHYSLQSPIVYQDRVQLSIGNAHLLQIHTSQYNK